MGNIKTFYFVGIAFALGLLGGTVFGRGVAENYRVNNYMDVNMDGEITVLDFSLSERTTSDLIEHFGWENITEPLPYE